MPMVSDPDAVRRSTEPLVDGTEMSPEPDEARRSAAVSERTSRSPDPDLAVSGAARLADDEVAGAAGDPGGAAAQHAHRHRSRTRGDVQVGGSAQADVAGAGGESARGRAARWRSRRPIRSGRSAPCPPARRSGCARSGSGTAGRGTRSAGCPPRAGCSPAAAAPRRAVTVPSTRSSRGPGSTLIEPRPRFSITIARTPAASKVRAVIGPSPARCLGARDRRRVRRRVADRDRRTCRPRRRVRSARRPRTARTDRSRSGARSGRRRRRSGAVVEGDHHGPQQPGVGGDAVTIGLLVHLRLDRCRQPQADPSHRLVVLGSDRLPERRSASSGGTGRAPGYGAKSSGSSSVGSGLGPGRAPRAPGRGRSSAAPPTSGPSRR